MDFLDPRKRRAHKIRLHIGYFLMSIVITLGTVLIFNLAYGYDIDRKTGTLVSNGIIYIDSKPQNARIFINDIEQRNSTDTRLVLPSGVYTVRIEALGYRHWERTVDLNGHEIERLVYPYLIPNEFVTNDISTYDAIPGIATQSPDRRWLLVSVGGEIGSFDVYDLANPERNTSRVSLPKDLFSSIDQSSSLELVEWSTDNRHVLFEYTTTNATQFIMLDRENPDQSVNINTALGINPKVMSLKNKRPDQFYYLEEVPGVLRIADTKSRTISAPLLEGVIDYRTYGDDIVLYATQDGVADKSRADFRILEGSDSYVLKNVAKSEVYVMDVSKYDNKWYYVVGGSSESLAFVYRDPLSALRRTEHTPVNVEAILRLDNPRFVSFSAGTQFIGLQSGSDMMTLDLEKGDIYRFKLGTDVPNDQQIKWMDGHRYVYSVNEQSYIVDFDGSNENTLVTSLLQSGPFFDRDYDNVFTFEYSKSTMGKNALTMTVVDDR